MTTDKAPLPDDPEQSRRFIEMARTVEAHENDPAFDEKVKAIGRHQPKSCNTNKNE